MTKNHVRTVFYLHEKARTDLQIMCILTKKSMSDFIRIAIKDKIALLKNHGLDTTKI